MAQGVHRSKRLTGSFRPAAPDRSLPYDGFQKLRIKAATSPAATTHYIWDSFGHIIAEHNATGGAALKQYIWLGDIPLALIDGTTLYYVHPDNLDRPVFMTNASAMTVAWSAKFDPFGVPFAVTVSPVNNQRLPGQWFQLEDGLSYNWHRTYDPTLGRYTQADPFGFVDGPGLYGYAGQSAVSDVDPKGLMKAVPRMSVPPRPDEPKQCFDPGGGGGGGGPMCPKVQEAPAPDFVGKICFYECPNGGPKFELRRRSCPAFASPGESGLPEY